MAKIPITLTINGEPHEALIEPDRTLLDVLRTDLGLTGTKTNCLDAECGVCTVLVDGLAVNACLYLAVVAQGRAITTIEGLASTGEGRAREGALHPLQEAFVEHGAVQCGYCIPGMILAAKAIVRYQALDDRDFAEYVLIGTLTSLLIALFVGMGIRQLLM